MRASLLILFFLAVLPCTRADASSTIEVSVPDHEVLTEDLDDQGGIIATWDWGVVIRPAGAPALLALDDESFGIDTTQGLRTLGPRDAEGRAALTFVADRIILIVDGDVRVETVDGRTVLQSPDKEIDPRAGMFVLISLLLLTAVMIRHTRRSISSQ